MTLFQGRGFGYAELGIKPCCLASLERRALKECPGTAVLVSQFHTLFPVWTMGRRRHAPFRRTIGIDRGSWFHHVRGKSSVPEDLLGYVSLCQKWQVGIEIHSQAAGGSIFPQPFHVLAEGILCSRAVGSATAAHAGSHGAIIFVNANAPFIHRLSVRNPLVTATGHGEPGIRETPPQVRGLLAVVIMAIHPLAVDLFHMVGKKIGNVFIGRPVHRHTQFVPIQLLELLPEIGSLEPVIPKPVQVCELLIRKLVEFPVRAGGKGFSDKIIHIQGRKGDVFAFPRHEVTQGDHKIIAPVRADEIGVIDVGIVNILARGPLGLKFLNNISFLDEVMGNLDPGNLFECLCEHF